ncbi:hypothetical protein NEUTE1DRAFT_149807 [Neurospora tetrasperma FGSC 2508]|uniref:Dockerin type 1 n=1 Tax=Neurospora tetrasperma (strain FGSC 2508 / ATCC MYA-4615 / P0657) TaxID=510951 RepID=F8N0Y9_NEUT8|nr:uncharacterized protein NEUTE1DRAFT_149807 [Neurospora tetrasperma FGSC 2508]EGO52226.1 hypothetical protein NEUTE1DRAFT_149807 [Neurospora tetrasperma FGSC 2508]
MSPSDPMPKLGHQNIDTAHVQLPQPVVTNLGCRSATPGRKHKLNAYAFQQDAIVTFKGYQYVAYWSNAGPDDGDTLYLCVARRLLRPRSGMPVLSNEDQVSEKTAYGWEVLELRDYKQTVDDGHNTISLGICPGDGTIHLAFDHHCDILRYRYSKRDVATQPRTISWRPDIFSATLDCLPGILSTHKPLRDVTYPRFGFLGENMFFSHRDGKAGLGNDHLYTYNGKDGRYEYIGPYLTGVQSSPYVNGMTSRDGVLYVTWVYRGFVEYPGWDDPLDTKHKQQAGPNGAENNHNICYAYSDADGYVWKNGCGEVIADLRDPAKFPTSVRGKERTIKNDCSGIAAFDIPKGKGLMNQEAQAVDQEGGVHVLNRDMMNEGGTYLWKHYHRSPDGTWTQRALQVITEGSNRGQLAISKTGDLYAILPDSTTKSVRILRATKASEFADYREVWKGDGLGGEPLVDSARLEYDNVLSVFARHNPVDSAKQAAESQAIAILDFELFV